MSGLLLIISGPSGAGKGTVVKELVKDDQYALSISATTRTAREYEQHGREYFFNTREEFAQLIKDDMLLEYAEYVGNCYGTPKAYVEEQIAQDRIVILEIEVEGALQVKAKFPDAVLVFLVPPSMEELERRLQGRNTETQEVIDFRLTKARQEMNQLQMYDHVVLNDEVNLATAKINQIVATERVKTYRNQSNLTKNPI